VSVQNVTEKPLKAKSGMAMMILLSLLALAGFAAAIIGGIIVEESPTSGLGITLLSIGMLWCFVFWIPFLGLKVLKPQESLVLTLFGKYIGTLRGAGFFYVNPFAVSVNPTAGTGMATATEDQNPISPLSGKAKSTAVLKKVISLKVMTLNNNKQKVNDLLGNPIEIGIVVIWRVVDTAKAVFNVENFKAFLSIQCDSALRNIARLYPYDVAPGGEELTLRGSSKEVADRLKEEISSRVEIAGLEVMEARVTSLSYAPEIAAVMLQRQQASAIIDARKMIVDGAVGMVEMALARLNENGIVNLDEERKAAMVSNLLVVLCGNKDAQPVVNSGSLY